MDGFGIPPEIEFAAIFPGPIGRNDGSDAAAHHDEFLREIGNCGSMLIACAILVSGPPA